MTKYRGGLSLRTWCLFTVLVVSCQASSSDTSCFCQLHGQIDDCSCDVDTVDHFNNIKLYPRLNSLLNKNYFRFFKVNLRRPCPFWTDESHCSIKDCSVKACTEQQIPEGLKLSTPEYNKKVRQLASEYGSSFKYSKEANDKDDCEQELELSNLNTSISEQNHEDFLKWKAHDDALDNFCEFDDEMSSDMQYVDLLLNPERFTGYKGPSAHRIWRSIYLENCFKPKVGYDQYLDSQSVGGYHLEGMCLEKRAFYRAISGLHSSINIHLSARYLLNQDIGYETLATAKWGRNLAEFQSRFDPELTNGEGPKRLKNLYFLYLLELRAFEKAIPYLENVGFYTGNAQDDEDVRLAVKDISAIIKSFPNHFNDSSMFTGNKKQADILKAEFRKHFLNISRIMDCVGCEKCRLWGKLQVTGLGTALKILFSGDHKGTQFDFEAMKKSKFQLTRQEIVSFFNAFGRISNSIYELENFRKMFR